MCAVTDICCVMCLMFAWMVWVYYGCICHRTLTMFISLALVCLMIECSLFMFKIYLVRNVNSRDRKCFFFAIDNLIRAAKISAAAAGDLSREQPA